MQFWTGASLFNICDDVFVALVNSFCLLLYGFFFLIIAILPLFARLLLDMIDRWKKRIKEMVSEPLLKKARVVDVHHVDNGRGRRYFQRHETSSSVVPVSLHAERAKLVDKAGKQGAKDLTGRHVGTIVEHPDHPATNDRVAHEVSDNPASGIAAMLIRRRLEKGAHIDIPALKITLTKDDLPYWFHPRKSRRNT